MRRPRSNCYSICPCCRKHFGPVFSDIVYQIKNGNDAMFVLLCANCQIRYFSAPHSRREQMRTDGIKAIAIDPSDQWACVSLFALSLNGGDLDRAMEHGLCGMDRATYEALARTDDLINCMHPALALSCRPLVDAAAIRNEATKTRKAAPCLTRNEL